jgi:hypothetical protein
MLIRLITLYAITSVADPVFFPPGSGMNIQDLILENLVSVFFIVKILQFFDADPGSGKTWIRDPGKKNLDPKSGSATLVITLKSLFHVLTDCPNSC